MIFVDKLKRNHGDQTVEHCKCEKTEPVEPDQVWIMLIIRIVAYGSHLILQGILDFFFSDQLNGIANFEGDVNLFIFTGLYIRLL